MLFKLTFFLFLTIGIFTLCSGVSANSEKQSPVRLFITNSDISLLDHLDINWDHHKTPTERDCYVNEETLKAITALGISYEVLPDNSELYAQYYEQRPVRKTRSLSDLSSDSYWNAYHNYEDMTNLLKELNETYSPLCKLTSIGKSRNNRELWVMQIGDDIEEQEILQSEPQFKYVANMHGDEVVGRELLLRLIYTLLSQYEHSKVINKLVKHTQIFIMPSMNPDGYESKRRENGARVDLNRNFPDKLLSNDNNNREPETLAVMQWSLDHYFILSANLHGGDLVANYPFDGNSKRRSGVYTGTNDDDLFRHLAKTYSTRNTNMFHSLSFPEGITNGADWYVLYGGMQDWNYLRTQSDYDITLELSYDKWPSPTLLSSYWESNKLSLIAYIAKVHQTICGSIDLQLTDSIRNVTITVAGYSDQMKNDSPHDRDPTVPNQNGFFWRPVVPGVYNVTFSFPSSDSPTNIYIPKEVKAVEINSLDQTFDICDPSQTFISHE